MTGTTNSGSQSDQPTGVLRAEKLLPCPFCGSHELWEEMRDGWTFILCDECGGCGPWFENDFGSAKVFWNCRALHGLTESERKHVEACRHYHSLDVGIPTLSGQRALITIIERLARASDPNGQAVKL